MNKINKEIKVADTLSREEFQQHVISKAESSPEFKRALLSDPKQAIGQLGLKVNGDVNIKVVEESADVIYLVLPQKLKAITGGCIGCDGVGGCGFCECKSSIGNRLNIR
ncbi:TOMM precursor peptide, NHLP family [Methanosarcina horonobensis HB-1 = JCM 15518]|uniref:TOMM peptide, NHLP family n=1 Tax=Methanosarcina horonobensis HB-1 = JCM 15518 TaxID=1434110 RepID=A0A0E3WUQ1_9EURY